MPCAYNLLWGVNMKISRTIIDIIMVSLLGTLLHFTYELSGKNFVVGIFSAINESVWEHLKLLFWPLFLVSFIEYFLLYSQKNNFWLSRLLSLLIGVITILTLHYTITGIVGKNIGIGNIIIYYIAVITAFIADRIFMKNLKPKSKIISSVSFLLFIGIAFVFFAFTQNPPTLAIFAPPN